MMQRPSRPAGVTILAVLQILIGVVGLLASLAIIGLSALASTLPSIGALVGTFGLVIGGIVFFFSIVWLATGFGFIHGRGWAWTLGMIFSVLSLLGAISALAIGLTTGGIVGAFFWCLMLYYLTRSHVKQFFGKGGYPITPSYPMAYSPRRGLGQPQSSVVTSIPSYARAPVTPQSPPSSQPTGVANPSPQMGVGPNTPTAQSSGNGTKALVSCPYCGSRLTMGSPKCLTCGASI